MSGHTVAEKNISQLKSRLDIAINTRKDLEEDLRAQSSLLTGFISKLSHTCKGADILLDNKLAKLRTTIKKATSFADLEKEIETISTLLQQHSLLNDKSIKIIQEQLQSSGARLQKVKNLPPTNRRLLKTIIDKIQQGQASLVQYVPLMREFIVFYESLLNIESSKKEISLVNTDKTLYAEKINKISVEQLETISPSDNQNASTELLGRFNSILNTLVISSKHKANINEIKSSLKGNISNHILMTKCLTVFDFIIEDLKQERSTAKIFLSTLSETLTSVQASVNTTIASTTESNLKNDKINAELKAQINEMSAEISGAGSITEIKVDVNYKLQQIAKTFKAKTLLEEKQRLSLQDRLVKMSAQVKKLELQSQSFEKRIQEQQAKSLQDSLTKLANRAAFDEYFAKEIVRYHHEKFDLAISVIDLDDFKRINDTYGHIAGDKTLQVIANTLTKVMGDDAFIGRYGGEEFVLVFGHTNKADVISKLNVLRKKVASLPFTFKNDRVSITLSIGITMIEQNDNVHSAFERADTALYQAKKDGKNRVLYG
ncbi:MAG: GGDEF domain-containing protein [Cognaticolwellia sp.]